MVNSKNSKILHSNYPEIRLRVSPKVKVALQDLAKSRRTTVNNLGLFLVNDILQKKPDLEDVLLENKTFRPGIAPQVLVQYRSLLESYSLMRFSYLEGCLQGKECAHFMEMAKNLIEILALI